MTVFNRQTVRRHRDRAAVDFTESDFLFREVATRLLDRLDDVTAKFPTALDLGCHNGTLGELYSGRGGIQTLIGSDLSPAMVSSRPSTYASLLAADEELLPFGKSSLDLVLSNLSLHWVNDLPGALTQACQALRPDGLFLATMFGGDTLFELRTSLSEAEIAIEGGLSPRVSPFTDIRDAGSLLQRAGFALPVVDTETITISYENPLKLLHDLRGMGETNAVADSRKGMMHRETMMSALQLYQDKFGDENGRITATFQVLYLSGWSPAPTQQSPLKPGEGQHSLKDFFDTD